MTSWTPNLTGTAAAAWLTLTQLALVFAAPVFLPRVPAFAQDSPNPSKRKPSEGPPKGKPSEKQPTGEPSEKQSEAKPSPRRPKGEPSEKQSKGKSSERRPKREASEKPSKAEPAEKQARKKASEKQRRISYGVEIELGSGHADRGLIISDGPVVQPVTWVSGSLASFSVWGNLTLAETTDGSRPQILEMELTRGHAWRNLTIAPAVRMFLYRDPLSRYSSRSIEGWLYLSYAVRPFRLYTNHSVDVLTQRGAYFGEAGIAYERRVSQRIEAGVSVDTGWASSRFNAAYVGIDKAALNRMSIKGWLTAYVKPRLYVGPQFEFSTILDRALRAKLVQPTFFFVGLTTGVDF